MEAGDGGRSVARLRAARAVGSGGEPGPSRPCARGLLEAPRPQEPDHRARRVPAVDDEKVGAGQDQHRHPLDARLLDAHDPVVGAGYGQGADRLHAAASGDDPHFVVGWGEGRREIGAVGAEGGAHLAERLVGAGHVPEPLDEVAALVGWRQQHHAPEVGRGGVGEVAADDEAAERMSHEVEGGRLRAAALHRVGERGHLLGERSAAGVVGDDLDAVARPLQALGEDRQGGRRTAQSVDHHDRLPLAGDRVCPAAQEGEREQHRRQSHLPHGTSTSQ